MKIRTIVGMLALLCSSVGFAATVTITPSSTNVVAGETFSVTASADALFPANVIGGSLLLTWDASRVSLVSMEVPGGATPTGPMDFASIDPVTGLFTVLNSSGPTPAGPYDLFTIRFIALDNVLNQTSSGSASIFISDVGQDGWITDTFDPVPVTTVQADVMIDASPPAPGITVEDEVVPTTDLAIPFGSITVGGSSTKIVTVNSVGSDPLVLGDIALLNPLAPFSIGTDNCSSQTIASSDSCTFEVLFQPVAVGPFNDSIEIPSNDPDTATVTVTVSGTGAPVMVPDITVTDSVDPDNDLQVDFGVVNVSTSADQTVTVTNEGAGDLVIGTVGAANPLAAPFSIVAAGDHCSGQTLETDATCTISVRFAPGAIQVYNDDSFSIPSNDPDEATVTVTVSGAGDVSDIVVTDSVDPDNDLQIGFGDVDLSATADQTITVTNNGAAPLVIGTVGAANPLAAPFSVLAVADFCSGQTLAHAATCTIIVEFAPGAIQTDDDSFSIPSNDPDEATVTVAVSGSGVRLSSGGGSALDPETLLGLALLGLAARRRRRSAAIEGGANAPPC